MRFLSLFCLTAGLTAMAVGPTAGRNESIARNWLRARQDDRAERMKVESVLPAGRDARIVQFQDEWNGLPVFQSGCRLLVQADGSVRCLEDSTWAVGRGAGGRAVLPILSGSNLIARAAVGLGLTAPRSVTKFEAQNGSPHGESWLAPDLANAPVSSRLLWYRSPGDMTSLGWEVQIPTADGRHWWVVLVDDATGKMVWQNDLARECEMKAAYPPAESPSEEAPSLIPCPADSEASPYGWFDLDGQPGADSTKTRGVNVFAQEDMDGDNAAGIQPDAGSSLVFDYPLDLSLPPTRSRDASIVHSFAIHNWVHDVMYHHGFGPADGNYQYTNYGRGGVDGDPIYVDVLDGAGTNNAITIAPADGQPGRLNFYIFSRNQNLHVSTPGFSNPDIAATGATFGGGYPGNGVTGLVVRAFDESNASGTATNDACTVITNAAQISGHIALIERGTCTFMVKVKQAQIAGAIAAIIVNNQGDTLVPMTGDDPSILIPAMFIGRSDGTRLKAALDQGSVQVVLSGQPFRESGLDNTLALHEHGHLITQRLTGGPANPNCLAQLQGRCMSEGWSDWYALVLTARAQDTPEMPRVIGAFSNGNNALGIRRVPYSTSTNVDPRVFADLRTVTLSRPHDGGEIWCSVLWDLHWKMVLQHGFSADFIGGDAGNQRVLRLVTEALKLQPCQPTFLDGRDALLQADQLLYGGENSCMIWRAFAGRGMGLSANDAGASSSNLVTSAFDHPAQCDATPPRITTLGPVPPEFFIAWDSIPGAVYQIQQRSLGFGNWTAVSGSVTAGVNSASAFVQSGTNAVHSLRVVLQSSPGP